MSADPPSQSSSHVRVLLAGGTDADAAAIRALLDASRSIAFEIVHHADLAEALALAEARNVDVMLLLPASGDVPLLAPLADFAQVSRPTTITAWIMGHGLALMVAPTSVVLVGGLAIAKVDYDKYLRFVWPLLLALLFVYGRVARADQVHHVVGAADHGGGVARPFHRAL